jgi:hypothetical protein
MTTRRHINAVLALGLVAVLAACGGGNSSGGNGFLGLGGGGGTSLSNREANVAQTEALARAAGEDKPRSTIWDIFRNQADPNTVVKVNKYIWNASLDVLNFLPIESVDPFTGVIVTGYGTPPGGGRAYRATIYVQDPALDARSLKLAMQSSGGGAVAPETIRAIEDAILSRARQLRIADSRL